MDMFLKMYNVKRVPVRDATQTLLQAHVSYFKAQSVRARSKWLRQSVVVSTPHVCSQKVIRQIKMCQIWCWSSSVSEARWHSELRAWTVGHSHGQHSWSWTAAGGCRCRSAGRGQNTTRIWLTAGSSSLPVLSACSAFHKVHLNAHSFRYVTMGTDTPQPCQSCFSLLPHNWKVRQSVSFWQAAKTAKLLQEG